MPHINRIRVNNIKYNVGTQFYDDLCLRFQGKNSLYDLANGGGKECSDASAFTESDPKLYTG